MFIKLVFDGSNGWLNKGAVKSKPRGLLNPSPGIFQDEDGEVMFVRVPKAPKAP